MNSELDNPFLDSNHIFYGHLTSNNWKFAMHGSELSRHFIQRAWEAYGKFITFTAIEY